MDAIIDVLNENKQSWQKIGELESQVGQLEREKSSLVADKSRLQSEKDSSEDRWLFRVLLSGFLWNLLSFY